VEKKRKLLGGCWPSLMAFIPVPRKVEQHYYYSPFFFFFLYKNSAIVSIEKSK
jgi:hypothetical protein